MNYIDDFQKQSGEPFISYLKELIEFLTSLEKIKHITILKWNCNSKDDLIDTIDIMFAFELAIVL